MHCTEGNLRQMQNGCGNYENKFKKFKGERDEKKKELSCVMYRFQLPMRNVILCTAMNQRNKNVQKLIKTS